VFHRDTVSMFTRTALKTGARPNGIAKCFFFLVLATVTVAPVQAGTVDELVYDGFKYESGDDLKKKNGGFGWDKPWQKNNKRMEIVENSLSYTDTKGNSLLTRGNRVERIQGDGDPYSDALNNDSKYERTYATELGVYPDVDQQFDPDPPNDVEGGSEQDQGRDVIWGSILIQGANDDEREVFEREADGDIKFGQGVNGEQKQYEAAAQSTGSTDGGVQPNGLLGTDPDKTKADLLVSKLNFDTNEDSETFKFWINPDDLTASTLTGASDAEGYIKLDNVSDLDPQQLDLYADINGAAFDEVRKGESYSAVTPVPTPGGAAMGAVGLVLAGLFGFGRFLRRV